MDLGLRFGEKFRTRERKEKKKNTTVERERDGGEDCKARRNPQRFSGLFNFDHKSFALFEELEISKWIRDT